MRNCTSQLVYLTQEVLNDVGPTWYQIKLYLTFWFSWYHKKYYFTYALLLDMCIENLGFNNLPMPIFSIYMNFIKISNDMRYFEIPRYIYLNVPRKLSSILNSQVFFSQSNTTARRLFFDLHKLPAPRPSQSFKTEITIALSKSIFS